MMKIDRFFNLILTGQGARLTFPLQKLILKKDEGWQVMEREMQKSKSNVNTALSVEKQDQLLLEERKEQKRIAQRIDERLQLMSPSEEEGYLTTSFKGDDSVNSKSITFENKIALESYLEKEALQADTIFLLKQTSDNLSNESDELLCIIPVGNQFYLWDPKQDPDGKEGEIFTNAFHCKEAVIARIKDNNGHVNTNNFIMHMEKGATIEEELYWKLGATPQLDDIKKMDKRVIYQHFFYELMTFFPDQLDELNPDIKYVNIHKVGERQFHSHDFLGGGLEIENAIAFFGTREEFTQALQDFTSLNKMMILSVTNHTISMVSLKNGNYFVWHPNDTRDNYEGDIVSSIEEASNLVIDYVYEASATKPRNIVAIHIQSICNTRVNEKADRIDRVAYMKKIHNKRIQEGDKTAGINQTDPFGLTPLLLSFRFGQRDLTMYYLQDNPHIDLNAATITGDNALWNACLKGDGDMVRKLFAYDNNLSINKNKVAVFSPMYFACNDGRTDIVKILFNHADELRRKKLLPNFLQKFNLFSAPPKVNEWSSELFGMTPFQVACLKGHTDIVRLFLNYSDKPNLKEFSRLLDTSITLASKNGHSDCVGLLLEHIDDKKRYLQYKNYSGRSALMLACHNNHSNIIDAILSHIDDKEAYLNENYDVFEWACENNNVNFAKRFLTFIKDNKTFCEQHDSDIRKIFLETPDLRESLLNVTKDTQTHKWLKTTIVEESMDLICADLYRLTPEEEDYKSDQGLVEPIYKHLETIYDRTVRKFKDIEVDGLLPNNNRIQKLSDLFVDVCIALENPHNSNSKKLDEQQRQNLKFIRNRVKKFCSNCQERNLAASEQQNLNSKGPKQP